MKEKDKLSGLISGLVIDELLQRGLISQEMADRARELFLVMQRRANGKRIKDVA